MKRPFDRIVGPDGGWKAPEPGDEEYDPGQDAREEFMLRCLNAAVNLRGVMTYGEFCELYNHYAGKHDAPVSDPLGEDELDGFVAMALASEEDDGSFIDGLIDQFGICFATWRDPRTGERLIVRDELVDTAEDERQAKRKASPKKLNALVDKRVSVARDAFSKMELPRFDEETFLSFEFPDEDDESEDGDGGDYYGDYHGNYDDYDDDDEGAPITAEELPPAKLTGPFDFKSVKDPVVRDRLLWDYEGVRAVTRDFVRHEVMRELTQEERRDAAKRLGFEIDPETGFVLDANLDMVVGDFASMMDDQHAEPAIKRVLKRKDKLERDLDRAAAEYYENYRYTWLEVLAVKSGLGVKCRDLLTGEELFLMEQSFSLGDVKGMTICVGIAPMGEVYLALGVIHPTHFENPATILKIVLTHLGLPTELPIRLSFADQARFAAETIRRIHANGRFDNIDYGGGE